MKRMHSSITAIFIVLVATLVVPHSVQAQQTWSALAGAQTKDMATQAIAFLPNEMWIHAGDSITWTSASGDIHTVSFLIAHQPLTDFTTGCPGFSNSGVSFNGTSCVTAPPLTIGQEFTVKFPTPGNYKLICLVHTHMTGVIHVLPASATLPYNQDFYNEQAAMQQRTLLSDGDQENAHRSHSDMNSMLTTRVLSGKNQVAAGIGEMSATAAGFQSSSVVRFLSGTIQIRANETVEWSILDPAMPHTITFGTEPGNPGPPSPNVTTDPDGARHATLNSPTDSAHSGILVAAPQNQANVPQSPPGMTVFRVTFTAPGTYDYKCALHDNLGMVGKVVVMP